LNISKSGQLSSRLLTKVTSKSEDLIHTQVTHCSGTKSFGEIFTMILVFTLSKRTKFSLENYIKNLTV